jgi:hypothetical protein
MKYYDYSWDLHNWGIQLDEEINAEKLASNHNWHEGDYFKLIKRGNGMVMVKVDPLVKFLNDGVSNE